MENRKNNVNGFLIFLMALIMITAFSVTAFAKDAVSESPAVVTADQDDNKGVKSESAEEKAENPGLSAQDALAEIEGIYRRIWKIEKEFEEIYESHTEEIETLMEQAEALMKRMDRHVRDRCKEDPLEKWPGKEETEYNFTPDRDRYENDRHSEHPEDQSKSDSGTDSIPFWSEIIRRLEEESALDAQNNDERETEEKAARKPHVGLMVSTLSDEEKAITGIQAGVLVHQANKNSPAEKAGIQTYDIIVKVNESEIHSVEDLASIIVKSAPGDVLHFHLYRQGSALELDVIPVN